MVVKWDINWDINGGLMDLNGILTVVEWDINWDIND